MKKIKFFGSSLILILLLSLVVGCRPSSSSQISMTIIAPSTGEAIIWRQETNIVSLIEAPQGWSWVELYVNDELVRLDTAPSNWKAGEPTLQPWIPLTLGPTLLRQVVYGPDEKKAASAEVAVLVTESAGTTIAPTLTPTAPPTPTALPTSSSCTLAASLIRDLSIPPGSILKPGEKFTKSWLIQNSGTCRWENYRFVFISGSLLGGQSPSTLPIVEPAQQIEFSLDLVAPKLPGEYSGVWKIQAANGTVIGPEFTYFIQIPAPTPTATSTATSTATATLTATVTTTPTSTATATLTATATTSPTATTTATVTPSQTATPTQTFTATFTSTATYTATVTPELTQTSTLTPGERTPAATTDIRPDIPRTVTPTVTYLPGLSGSKIVIATANLNAGLNATLGAACPDGSQPVGGGYALVSGLKVFSSVPNGQNWEVNLTNFSGVVQPAIIYAQCLAQSSGTLQFITTKTEMEHTKAALGIAVCPEHTEIVSGGFNLPVNSSLSVFQSTSIDSSWQVGVLNAIQNSEDFFVTAICLSQTGTKVQQVAAKSLVQANTTRQLEIPCPTGTIPLSAGQRIFQGLSIEKSLPTTTGWLLSLRNTSQSPAWASVSVLCLQTQLESH